LQVRHAFTRLTSLNYSLLASNDDHTQVQLVDVPAGSKIGERISVAGENGPVDKSINLSSKENVFKLLQEVNPLPLYFPFMTLRLAPSHQ
jgi:hypothetical protein